MVTGAQIMQKRKKASRILDLERKYDEAYFHGKGSGYGKAGYENEHADWRPQIDLVCKHYGKNLRWLDAGCAYGYLIEQAVAKGIDAVGVDVSSYALRQHDAVRGRLLQSPAENLPFRDDSFDVVSLYDLVEHSETPELVLREMKRVLKPKGVCFLSTPDPLYFHREEPTHVHERPPSYWINLLQSLGFDTGLRFGGREYELEIIAFRSKSKRTQNFCLDFQAMPSALAECIELQGEPLHLAPRTPVPSRELKGRSVWYALNPRQEPVRLSLSLHTPEERHPDIFLADLKIRYAGCSKSDSEYVHRWHSNVLPPGGCDLTFHVEGDALNVSRLAVKAESADPERHLLELSFDHYQRYRLVSEILDVLKPKNLSVLDVGGRLGFLNLFSPAHKVNQLDVVWEDVPDALIFDGDEIPCKDKYYDVVVSVDTLEHIPTKKRERFLSELCRTAKEAVLLCGPFEQPEVTDAEGVVRDFANVRLGKKDKFLQEHAEHTLPGRAKTLAVLKRNGFSVMEIPNGYLPRWLSMQLAGFSLGVAPELAEAKGRLNALYNENYYRQDNREPAYRWASLAVRKPLATEQKKALQALMTTDEKETSPALWNVASLIVELSNYGVIQEKEISIGKQSERIDRLLDHQSNLVKLTEDEKALYKKLLEHTQNLDALLKGKEERLSSLERHGENLADLLKQQKLDAANHHALNQELQKHNRELQAHIANLDIERKALEKHLENLDEERKALDVHLENLDEERHAQAKHLDNLDEERKSYEKHLANLDEERRKQQEQYKSLMKHSENLTDHIKKLETGNRDLQQHGRNLEKEITRLQDHTASLMKHISNVEKNVDEQKIHTRNMEKMLDENRNRADRSDREKQDFHKACRDITDKLKDSERFGQRLHLVLKELELELQDTVAPAVTEPIKKLVESIRAIVRERDRCQKELEAVCSSTGYRVLAHVGILPQAEEPPDE